MSSGFEAAAPLRQTMCESGLHPVEKWKTRTVEEQAQMRADEGKEREDA